MPVEIDAAGDVGRRRPDARRHAADGADPDQALGAGAGAAARCRPASSAWRKAQEVRDQAMALAVAALTHRQATPRSHDVDVDLGDGRRLTGTVGPVYGARLVAVGYSRLGGKQLLQAWVRLLALAAADPDQHWTALVVGRAARGTAAPSALLGPADHGARRAAARPRRRSTTAAGASRCRCRSRRRSPGPRRAPRAVTTRCRPREQRVEVATAGIPARTPTRATSGSGASTRRSRRCSARCVPTRTTWASRTASERWSARLWWPAAARRAEPVMATRRRRSTSPATLPRPARPRVLEASAGTGKTFALAGLVTRYVAEGARHGSTRCCSSRSAGRPARSCASGCAAQLVAAARALDDPGPVADDNDAARATWSTATAASSPPAADGCATRSPSFDAATIATTHQFCQLVLRSLGVAGDTDAGADAGREPRRPGGRGRRRPLPRAASATTAEPPAFTRAEAARRSPATSSATRTRTLTPERARPGHGRGGRGSASPARCCAELERRKRRLGILGYDDLLSRLAQRPRRRRRPRARSGCATGGGSSWSTSSRTPTRCSGTCSTGPSSATRRWC